MNNQQFRRLVIDTPARQNGASSPPNKSASTPGAASLGSRARSSIPMTPRTVKGSSSLHNDFARQLAERNAGDRPTKKFRSAAPKGSKLASGYRDRTQDRVDEEEESDEKAKRIKALEEAMKLGQIERETYEQMVEEITGGDIAATHLVKGLDRKLLERVRRGEDVLSGTSKEEEKVEDVEDEFEKLEEQEIAPVVREKVEKKGEMAPPVAKGVKRNRGAILAELKASRKAAAEAAEAEREAKYPTLGTGFRKIGENRESSRIEIDDKGREVLIVTDASGNEKRKIRKQKVEQAPGLPKNAKPLDFGLKVPELPPAPPAAEEEEDDDIFEGVGSNYNPLAALEADSDSSSEEDEGEEGEVPPLKKSKSSSEPPETETEAEAEVEAAPSEPQISRSPQPSRKDEDDKSSMPPPDIPRRNYFASTSTSETSKDTATATVMAALKKVRTMDPDSELLQTEESQKEARLKKRAAELAVADRDLEDMDMGFGSSRFDDEADMEDGERIKLAKWKGLGAKDDGEEDGKGEKKKRKRAPKKRKGDKNSAADVLKVMERNKEKTLG